MSCGRCNEKPKGSSSLVQTFVRHNDAFNRRAAKKSLCSDCLIGHTVPAFRPSLKKWSLGQVMEHRSGYVSSSVHSRQKFHLLFQNGSKEWVQIDQSPFVAYTAVCRRIFHRRNKKSKRSSSLPKDLGRPGSLNYETDASTPDSLHRPESRLFQPQPQRWRDFPLASPVFRQDSTQTTRNSNKKPKMSPLEQANNHSHYMEGNLSDSEHGHRAKSRLWTIDEDRLLLQAVDAALRPIKWPDIAKSVPKRTGKQCRERYINHLVATVKSSDWSPVEDAAICDLYGKLGSKWALLSRHLPGRSDNSIKNRFHYIRRLLEKASERHSDSNQANGTAKSILPAQTRAIYDAVRRTVAPQQKAWGDAIAVAMLSPSETEDMMSMEDYAFSFGPFSFPDSEGKTRCCQRCALVVPSKQTGRSICESTAWCEACCKTAPYLSGDVLRLQHATIKGESASSSTTTTKRVSLEE